MDEGGSHFWKWRSIKEKLFEKFCEWKADLLVVHDRDLKEYALLLADEMNLPDFKV